MSERSSQIFGLYSLLTTTDDSSTIAPTYEVRLEFEPSLAAMVKDRQWHPSQTVASHTDGSITLSLHVPLTHDFLHWVLSFGLSVHVSAPEELQLKLKLIAASMVSMYVKKAA